MSLYVNATVLAGTHIDRAFDDCVKLSNYLGGVSVATKFNGVSMYYHGQSLTEWKDEYCRRINADKERVQK
jgi:predicted transcriptional regulator of viral defense system